MKLILGIDPGTAKLGFGIIEANRQRVKYKTHGCIETQKGIVPEKRLAKLYREMKKIIKRYKPQVVAVEKIFFAKNAKTAMAIAEARGAALAAAAGNNREIVHYAPLRVKQAICGFGNATKKDVQENVKKRMKLKKIPQPDDAADGLAIALCYATMELHSFNQAKRKRNND